jgi:bacterial/archaeal transporter family-2 protein
LLFDHFGLLQAPRRADPVRIAGAILMIVGVLMVAAPWRSPPKPFAGTPSEGG